MVVLVLQVDLLTRRDRWSNHLHRTTVLTMSGTKRETSIESDGMQRLPMSSSAYWLVLEPTVRPKGVKSD